MLGDIGEAPKPKAGRRHYPLPGFVEACRRSCYAESAFGDGSVE
jgi:hypothetical protein